LDIYPDAGRSVFLPDRERCLAYLRRVRFKGNLKCVYCGSSEVRKDGRDKNGYQVYECNSCSFLKSFLSRLRSVSKSYLQGYLSFLALLINRPLD